MAAVNLDHRIYEPELMDSPALRESELKPTLRFLSFAHRYLGGETVLFSHLKAWARRWPKGKEITFLDVGTGGADVPLSLIRRIGPSVRVTAVDSSPVVARIARERAVGEARIEVIEEDFFRFARTGRRFDYVVASLVFHHLPDGRLVEALRLLDAMAIRGVLISDLCRSSISFQGVSLATRFLADRISRYDGPLSVRKAFTVDELNGLARKAGLDYLRARRHFFFRLSLAGEKERTS